MLGQSHLDLPRGVRIYGPRELDDQFYLDKKKDEILLVRAKIERIYNCLPLDSHKGLLETGFCFGLLDPLNNIILNLAISSSRECPAGPRGEPSPLAGGEEGREPSPPAGGGGGGGGGGREHVPPRARGVKRGREPLTPAAEMAQRSLDGLTAFLTCVFPYLPDAEARKYLHAAGADPLVASLLIVRRRRMQFDYNSHTAQASVEVALRCAAVAAKHPDPQRFVRGWKFISPIVEVVVSPFAVVEALSRGASMNDLFFSRVLLSHVLEAIKSLETIASDPVFQLSVSWDLAKIRFERANPEIQASLGVLPPTRAHMKRMLLSKIHGFYIDALGSLPKSELCGQYHRSILMGGYCYGPWDPVSNILLNSIWYEQRFPPNKQLEVSMISTQMLWRIAARSLYGLVSFLCTVHQCITPDKAIEFLLAADVNLIAALDKVSAWCTSTTCPCDDSSITTYLGFAFTAASTAAFHCLPHAQAEFLVQEIRAFQVLSQHYRVGYQLSSVDMSAVCMVLESCSNSRTHLQQNIAPAKVKKRAYVDMCQCCDSFWGQHDRVTSMVRDALDKFNKTAVEGQHFELHIIFGVNEFVSGPVHCIDGKIGKYNPWSHDKYFRTHINFLAVRKDRPFHSPTLFFAECGKDGDDTCWCVPVIPQKHESEKARCIYCEHEASRIVHPTVEGFCGRDEFVELFYLSDREFYNNDEIIDYNGIYVDWVHDVADEAIYINFCQDDDDDGGDAADWIDIY